MTTCYLRTQPGDLVEGLRSRHPRSLPPTSAAPSLPSPSVSSRFLPATPSFPCMHPFDLTPGYIPLPDRTSHLERMLNQSASPRGRTA
jgi:hypothetical protein